ncbi:MAG TPA: transposase [Planctomycetota bacterium]
MKRRKKWREGQGDYHVFNRGARQLHIFADDEDRRYFMRLLALTARKHAILVLAWCLMDTHYHLSLRTDGARMGRMLRDLEKTYARYFNKRTCHVGALFEGRFGSVWLPDMRATAYVSRYIHANCRDKGARPETYPWSSCGAYLRGDAPTDWFDPTPVLEWVGGPDAYKTYLEAVPALRKRQPAEVGPQAALIEQILDRVREAFPDGSGKYSVNALACWVATRFFALKPKVLARVLGYSSGHTVSSTVSRLAQTLRREPEMLKTLSNVLTK